MLSWMSHELADLERRGLRRERRRVQSPPGVRLRIAGRDFLSFASNDYLNLAEDPRLARSAARAARRFGTGAGASPLVCGYLPPHRLLERALRRWERTPSALVFSSGFAANLAVASALAGGDDVIFSDALNHASLIDGCRLSRARLQIYRHGDVDHLQELVVRSKARRRYVVTDTLFSMDGDFAPLSELIDLARRHECHLIVDEAHATGVFGERGCGLAELVGGPLSGDDFLIKVGTLSKALGSQGGFVCGSATLVKLLVNRARPYIFSTALAPPAVAAARRALSIVADEPERRRRLIDRARLLRRRLGELGLSTGKSCSQIVPIIVGDCRSALELSRALEDRGLLVPAIRPPSVPQGTARLRISLTAGHSEEDIDRLVEALSIHRRLLPASGVDATQLGDEGSSPRGFRPPSFPPS